VKEGDQVKKGDKLISLEDTVHKANLNAAEAELAVAKSNLQDAEAQAKKKWELEIEKQKELIEGARQEMIVADNEVIIAKELFEAKPPQVNKEQFQMAQSKAEGRKAAVKALEFALEQLRLQNPQGIIDRAREDMKAKQALRDKAQQALVECDLVAPSDGIVLRIFASKGDVLNGQPAKAAVHFCPDLPRIIRVEILQEWANKLQEGQLADIEDDTRSGVQWKGKVERISKWFSPRRNPMQEPFQFNDVRTLECIVHLDPGGPPLRIGQRVRVIIRQGGP
jgi:multidrug resistance efflux pump